MKISRYSVLCFTALLLCAPCIYSDEFEEESKKLRGDLVRPVSQLRGDLTRRSQLRGDLVNPSGKLRGDLTRRVAGVDCDGKVLKNAPPNKFYKCGTTGEPCHDCYVSEWESPTKVTSINVASLGMCQKCSPLIDGAAKSAAKPKKKN